MNGSPNMQKTPDVNQALANANIPLSPALTQYFQQNVTPYLDQLQYQMYQTQVSLQDTLQFFVNQNRWTQTSSTNNAPDVLRTSNRWLWSLHRSWKPNPSRQVKNSQCSPLLYRQRRIPKRTFVCLIFQYGRQHPFCGRSS